MKTSEDARRRKRESNARIRARDPEAWRNRQREYTRRWKAKHPPALAAGEHRRNLKRFGLTPEQYDAMLAEQGGVCAICQRPDADRRLAVDHDHATGRVRGLLCKSCNKALGAFRDSTDLLLRAVEYLT